MFQSHELHRKEGCREEEKAKIGVDTDVERGEGAEKTY